MNIVILDAGRTNPGDLSWKEIERLGELTIYDRTLDDEVIQRSKPADVIVTNKVKFTRERLSQLPQLKLICQLATGYDNIDTKSAKEAEILVCNAVGYSTDSVAQQVMALALNSANLVARHNAWVQGGYWATAEWSHTLSTIHELKGKVLGIYGFGKIGQRVAILAQAFGMSVIAHHKHPKRDARDGVDFVSLDELFAKSDIITLHAPLSSANSGVINKPILAKMKPTALLINTGRGGLINDSDLRDHLMYNPSNIAALDVLSQEPPPIDHPLIGLHNCIITPHNAWASYEARQRLIKIVAENISSYINGKPQNVVNP